MNTAHMRALGFLLLLLSFSLQAADSYRFERMWPTLQQPWYFGFGGQQQSDLLRSKEGFVYISDVVNERLIKMNSSGQIVTTQTENEAGMIAIDQDGFIYSVDGSCENSGSCSVEVRKYDANLNFLKSLFSVPLLSQYGVDDLQVRGSYIYVVIKPDFLDYHFSISRHSLVDGTTELEWFAGEAEPHNNHVFNVEVGYNEVIYVGGGSNIYSYDSSGNRTGSWSLPGDAFQVIDLEPDQSGGFIFCQLDEVWRGDATGEVRSLFHVPASLGFEDYCWKLAGSNFELETTTSQADIGANILVYGYAGIYELDQNGMLLQNWSTLSSNEIRFDVEGASSWSVDSEGNFYSVEYREWSGDIEQKLQLIKRNRNMEVVSSISLPWPHAFLINGDFFFKDERFYLLRNKTAPSGWPDIQSSIIIYSLNGELLTTIDLHESDSGVIRLAVGENGELFTVVRNDQSNDYSIVRFDIQGQKLEEYVLGKSSVTVFELTADNNLLAFSDNKYLLFDSGLNILMTKAVLTSDGRDRGRFGGLAGTDNAGNVHILFAEAQRLSLLKLDSNLEVVEEYSIEYGFGPGQFSPTSFVPSGSLLFDSQQNLYLFDTAQRRMQKFGLSSITDNSKAIVLSGGGPFAGNNLWDSTQVSANFAYRTLTYQGFTKDSIYYLSSDTDLDLDLNGVADDVDADATNANLEYAIREWAADADNLVIYLVDHGGVDTFRMSGDEILYSSELADWINELQAVMPGRVTIIYDACESGTFMSALKPPQGFDRTVITSTSPGENAVFVSQGSISFSNFFWTHVFNGLPLADAFDLASQALTSTTDHQHPMMDYNGDGLSDGSDLAATSNVFIGNGTDLQAEAPSIFGVSPGQVINGTTTATITAEGVTDPDGVSRVWAMVRSPDYQQGESGNAVTSLPSIELRSDGNGNFSGSWDEFTIAGTYQLAIYATDRIGNTSVPLLTTVSVQSPLTKRAILIAAGAANDPNYTLASNSTDVAYEALKQQGYNDDAIYYMNNNGVPGFDVAPALSNLEFYLNDITGQDTQDLVLYIVGESTTNAITIREGEVLTPEQLAVWLDDLSHRIAGNITVVLDTDNAGSFISALSGNKRIIVTSTGPAQTAHFLNQGDISFSHSYWRKVFNGSTVRDAYLYARSAMRFSAGAQEAQLDDNGDRIPNTKQDGELARNQIHGSGILLAGDEPLIGSVSANDEIFRNEQATITVNNVTTTGEIDKVIAVVTAPDQSTSTYTLTQSGTSYSSSQIDFSIPGSYDIALYARDTAGNLSLPSSTTIEVRERGFDLELLTDQSSYISGNTLNLSTSAIIDGTRAYSGPVDIYLQVILPDGSTFFLTDLSPSITTQPTPVLTNWEPTSLPGTPILSLPLPEGLPDGNYSWKLTFTKADESYGNPSGWMAQGRAVHAIQ